MGCNFIISANPSLKGFIFCFIFLVEAKQVVVVSIVTLPVPDVQHNVPVVAELLDASAGTNIAPDDVTTKKLELLALLLTVNPCPDVGDIAVIVEPLDGAVKVVFPVPFTDILVKLFVPKVTVSGVVAVLPNKPIKPPAKIVANGFAANVYADAVLVPTSPAPFIIIAELNVCDPVHVGEILCDS